MKETGPLWFNDVHSDNISNSSTMQDLYEKQQIVPGEPTVLVDEIRKRLNVITTTDQTFKQNGVDIFHFKETVPISQLFALYAINKISSLANRL